MTSLSLLKKCQVVFVIAAATSIVSPAQTFTSLFSFDGSDGLGPSFVSLVQGPDGNYYGTTGGGGDLSCNPPNGCGTVFRVTSSGKVLTVHSFEGADGINPQAGVILAWDKSLYGTTLAGGDLNCNPPGGCGTVFRVTPNGAITTLHTFESTDGAGPLGALLQAADGNLYGTTCCGGPNGPGGTIFKMSRQGSFATIHNFCATPPDCTDGNGPTGTLIQALDGNFYGTTSSGGKLDKCFGQGCGTVFRLTPAGKFTTLHRFQPVGGAYPRAGLLQASDGSLYGTTVDGGLSGDGTIFKIASTGKFTILHSFDYTDGANPYAPLIQGTDGNFYGTTANGNLGSSTGTAFMITPSGTLTTLYSFCAEFNCVDGNFLLSGLFQGTNGIFYGTTVGGGAHNDGTIFSLDTGLGPFISLVRNYGRIGSGDGVLGQGLTGTTGVSFNGTPASFLVLTDTFMKVTVPPGATNGYVTVTTVTGSLTSNVPFYIRQ